MAPEVILKSGHGIASDLFAVGVIGYECMLGKRPYSGSNRKEIKTNILNRQARIKEEDNRKIKWSPEALDFINKLLQRKHHLRLGADSPGSAKDHSWFRNFDWKSLEHGTMKSPLISLRVSNPEDNNRRKETTEEDIEEKSNFSKNMQIQKIFGEYFYEKLLNKNNKEDTNIEDKNTKSNTKDNTTQNDTTNM